MLHKTFTATARTKKHTDVIISNMNMQIHLIHEQLFNWMVSPPGFQRSATDHYEDGSSDSSLLTGYDRNCARWLHTWRLPGGRLTTGPILLWTILHLQVRTFIFHEILGPFQIKKWWVKTNWHYNFHAVMILLIVHIQSIHVKRLMTLNACLSLLPTLLRTLWQ